MPQVRQMECKDYRMGCCASSMHFSVLLTTPHTPHTCALLTPLVHSPGGRLLQGLAASYFLAHSSAHFKPHQINPQDSSETFILGKQVPFQAIKCSFFLTITSDYAYT